MSKKSIARRRRLATLAALVLVTATPAVKAAEIVKTEKDGRTEIVFKGRVDVGDSVNFAIATEGLPRGTRIVLDSGGGAAVDGMAIGQRIRKMGFDTEVKDGDFCASSCALMWVAGTERFYHEKSEIGFHKVYTVSYRRQGRKRVEIKTPNALGNAMVVGYMSQLGYDMRVVEFATSSEPEELAYLDDEIAAIAGAKKL